MLDSKDLKPSIFSNIDPKQNGILIFRALATMPEEYTEEKADKKNVSAYIPKSYIDAIIKRTNVLIVERKQRKSIKNSFIEFGDATTISTFTMAHSVGLHKGALSHIDIETGEGKLVLSAGEDKKLKIFNSEIGKIENEIKMANALSGCVFAHGANKTDGGLTAVVIDVKGNLDIVSYSQKSHKFSKEHSENLKEPLRNLSLHPLGYIVYALKGESSWIMYDVKEVL